MDDLYNLNRRLSSIEYRIEKLESSTLRFGSKMDKYSGDKTSEQVRERQLSELCLLVIEVKSLIHKLRAEL